MMGSFERISYNNWMARKAGSSKAMRLNQTNVCATAILPKLLQTGTPVAGRKPIKFDPGRAGNCSRNTANIVYCGLMAYGPTNGLYGTYGVKIYCAK